MICIPKKPQFSSYRCGLMHANLMRSLAFPTVGYTSYMYVAFTHKIVGCAVTYFKPPFYQLHHMLEPGLTFTSHMLLNSSEEFSL